MKIEESSEDREVRGGGGVLEECMIIQEEQYSRRISHVEAAMVTVNSKPLLRTPS